MKRIEFNHIVPAAFSHEDNTSSEIWCKDMVFEKGCKYLIEASSGRGKSTFCSYIVGYRHDYEGDILFDGNDVKCLTIADWTTIRREHIGYLFQELRLFPELTTVENINIKNSLTNSLTADEINGWIDRLALSDKKDTKTGLMSFGQQQRVAFIRALAQPFDFLILDEPISHLDESNAQVISDIVQEVISRNGAGLIITSIGKHMDIDYDKVIRL